MAAISPTVFAGPYTGNGDAAAFPFDFSIVGAADIAVYVDGVRASRSSHIVTFGATGGTVSFNVAPADGAQILLVSDPDFLQTSEFENEGAYKLSTVNTIHRRFSVRELVLKDGFDRALKVPFGATGPEIPLRDIPSLVAVGDNLLIGDDIPVVAADLRLGDGSAIRIAPLSARLARAYAVSDSDTPIDGAVSPSDRGARYEANRASAMVDGVTEIMVMQATNIARVQALIATHHPFGSE